MQTIDKGTFSRERPGFRKVFVAKIKMDRAAA